MANDFRPCDPWVTCYNSFYFVPFPVESGIFGVSSHNENIKIADIFIGDAIFYILILYPFPVL